MWIRLVCFLAVLVPSVLGHAQDTRNEVSDLEPVGDLEPLPPVPEAIDPGAFGLLTGSALVLSGVMLGGSITLGILAEDLDVESGAALVGVGAISTVLAIASSVGLAVAITGHYDERSRYPAWSWVGAALAAVGAALAVTAVVDGIANGWNERTPWLMTGAAFSAVGAIPVYAIGTSMYQ